MKIVNVLIGVVVVNKEIILITGVNGRVGARLAQRLSENYQVIGFDKIIEDKLSDVDYVTVDLALEESLHKGLKYISDRYSKRICSVVHLAVLGNMDGEKSGHCQRADLVATELLFKGLRKYQLEIGQFIFSSTIFVHTPSKDGEKINEHSPIIPKANESKSKVLIEDLIHRMQGDIPTAILRVGHIYDDRCHCLSLASQMQRIYARIWSSHIFPGDLNAGSPFLHVDDFVEAIALVIQKKKDLPHDLVLILGENQTYSYSQWQKAIGMSMHGVDWMTWSVPVSLVKLFLWFRVSLDLGQKNDLQSWFIDGIGGSYLIDTSRSKKMLGWQPKSDSIEYVSIWSEELKKDPAKWYEDNQLRPNQ
ncbi:MAG: NAD(P)-dependent oxidoreductase [Chlamydiia bacterium]|nr:NAD(P)-dependent oxidoreductase [Chlamydiia bacterium]